jgi:NADPH-dependent curcumin reductase CurA
VFVTAAAGAVGATACQIARIMGCRVIGSAGSDAKVEWLEHVAGVRAFNYKHAMNLAEAIAALAPDGLDVCFDNVGGAHLEAALANMKRHGRVVLCGMIGQYNATTPQCAPTNLVLAIGKRLTLRGFIVSDHAERRDAFMADMSRWLADDLIVSQETIYHGLDSAPAAFLALFRGENVGKMLVELAHPDA